MAKDATISSDIQLANAKVIYSIAPATGHNQVYNLFYYISYTVLCVAFVM